MWILADTGRTTYLQGCALFTFGAVSSWASAVIHCPPSEGLVMHPGLQQLRSNGHKRFPCCWNSSAWFHLMLAWAITSTGCLLAECFCCQEKGIGALGSLQGGNSSIKKDAADSTMPCLTDSRSWGQKGSSCSLLKGQFQKVAWNGEMTLAFEVLNNLEPKQCLSLYLSAHEEEPLLQKLLAYYFTNERPFTACSSLTGVDITDLLSPCQNVLDLAF